MTRIGFSIAILIILAFSILSYSIPPSAVSDTQDLQKRGFVESDYASAQLSKLNLSVIMNETEASVDGVLLLDYYNAENIAFDEIPFHIYPSGMRYQARQGSITIHDITSRGTSPNVTDIDMQEEQQLMWIELASPIVPGEVLSLNISFTMCLPDSIDRAGFYGTDTGQTRIYTFTGFYPMVCVYDEYDGWNTDPYIDVGDPFYFDMAYHDLRVNVPEEMRIAATGVPQEISTQSGRTCYHYVISHPVREVTFSASRYYERESVMFKGVNVTTYFLPASASIWESAALEQATQALDLFNSTYGIYPYPTLNVVEQHAYYGGMEYPCQVYVTRIIAEQIQLGSRVSWYHELVIAHEIAHQWWSQLVGDDCVDWGFLDEGLACWSHSYYAEEYYSDWEYFQVTTYLDSVRTFYAEYETGSVINQSNIVRPELTSFVDYVQAPLILEKLCLTIGEEAFLAALHYFFEMKSFGIATLNDLQDCFEVVCGSDLDWFFLPWFSNGLLPDYAISNAIFDAKVSTLSFTIVDLNEEMNDYSYSQMVPIMVFAEGNLLMVNTAVWVNGTTDCSFVLDASPNEIRLYYEGYVLVQLPDETATTYIYTDIAFVIGTDLVFVIVTGVVLVMVAAITLYVLRRRGTI